MMKLLIENGADINAVNKDNHSALFKALDKGIILFHLQSCKIVTMILSSCLEYEKTAEWLIENGIDANVGSRFNDSALIVAIKSGNRSQVYRKIIIIDFLQ